MFIRRPSKSLALIVSYFLLFVGFSHENNSSILMLRRGVAGMVTTMASSSKTNNKKLIVHWFRHGDLRLHDNPALAYSLKQANADVLPFFCFDKRTFDESATTPIAQSRKCGIFRAKFLLESVADLRQNLVGKTKSELIVGHGLPHEVLNKLLEDVASQYKQIDVVCQDEVVKEEQDAVKDVSSTLQKHCSTTAKVHSIWGSTMYELSDLPWYDKDNNLLTEDMPNVFTPFRNKVEKLCQIPKPIPTPTSLKPFPSELRTSLPKDCLTYMPTLKQLGYSDEEIERAHNPDARGVLNFRGGETAALARVKSYIWDRDLLKDYFNTRNGMIGADYSTKFSPWLAHGCLSARYIASECKRYEIETGIQNKSTYWVVFELLWRDFCKFFTKKHGNAIFYPGGTIGSDKKWTVHGPSVQAWMDGKTGYPLVDANMREMRATGFMSNRGRQNVASFLAIDLAQDWRVGGDWFESNLVDYDVYSNWFNWCAAAGMTGGRLNRFNIVKQSKDYDQHGEYVRLWLPELKDVPTQFVHEPWKMTQFQQTEYNCRLGVDYPNPIVPPSRPNNNNAAGGNNGRGRGGNKQNKNKKKGGGQQHQDNRNSRRNRHQKYEMKSLKEGTYEMK